MDVETMGERVAIDVGGSQMRQIARVEATPVRLKRLTGEPLRVEAEHPRYRFTVDAWSLAFEDAEGEPLPGTGEALYIGERVGICWDGDEAWGAALFVDDEPDWLELRTDHGEPLIQCLVGREPEDGPWVTPHGRQTKRKPPRSRFTGPQIWRPR